MLNDKLLIISVPKRDPKISKICCLGQKPSTNPPPYIYIFVAKSTC